MQGGGLNQRELVCFWILPLIYKQSQEKDKVHKRPLREPRETVVRKQTEHWRRKQQFRTKPSGCAQWQWGECRMALMHVGREGGTRPVPKRPSLCSLHCQCHRQTQASQMWTEWTLKRNACLLSWCLVVLLSPGCPCRLCHLLLQIKTPFKDKLWDEQEMIIIILVIITATWQLLEYCIWASDSISVTSYFCCFFIFSSFKHCISHSSRLLIPFGYNLSSFLLHNITGSNL